MRLIDADALPKYTGYALSADEVATAVENAPTIDAVPVVRCRECAVPHNHWTGCPNLGGLVTPPNFYCAFGKREDGADNG